MLNNQWLTRGGIVTSAAIGVFILAGTASAATITKTLSANADADIRSSTLADNSYNRDTLSVANLNADPTAAWDAKAYIRFKLPTDMGTVTSATFSITRAVAGAWNPVYDVSGLNDGVTHETDWVESNDSPGITWNSAPGNDTTSAFGFTNAASVGTFTVTGTNHGGAAGDTYTVTGTDLVNFINADTNGYITLMIGRTGATSSSSDQFASRAYTLLNPDTPLDGPTLKLTYTPTPEPGSLALLGVAGAAMLFKRRRTGR